jgi:hypothetical protein
MCGKIQRINPMKYTLTALITLFSTISAYANSPLVVAVNASKSGSTWGFSVTLKHADEGWDHYADGWGVYLADGTELGYRVLAHPHVNEQPFTRSLSGVKIPQGTKSVIIRPHDKVHGLGEDFIVKLK